MAEKPRYDQERKGSDRRSVEGRRKRDRRVTDLPVAKDRRSSPDRRSNSDRRSGQDRRKG